MKNIVSKMFVAGIAAAFSLVAAGAVFDLDYSVPAPATPTSRGMKPMLTATQDAGVIRQSTVAAPQVEGQLQVGDELNVTLFNDRIMKLYLSERTPSSANVASFLAKADGYGDEFVAAVVQAEGRIHIDIQSYLEDRVYSVLSTAADKAIVKEMDPHLLPVTPTQKKLPPMFTVRTAPSTPAAAGSQTMLGSAPSVAVGTHPRLSENGETKPTVDVLVAYDTAAASWAKANGGGLSAFAEIQVQKMNTVLANTGLDQDFRFRLVGVYEVGFNANGDIFGALDAAQGCVELLNGNSWSGVRAKRDELDADLVCVLVDNGSSVGTTGVGYCLEDEDDDFSEYAYSASQIRAVQQGHTMTHEVGHNMGAGHSDAMADVKNRGPQLYSYSSGYYFNVGSKKYHTIMAYNTDGYGNYYTSVPYFSSPLHKSQSVAVGDSSHDNTKTLHQTFEQTSKYRGGVVSSAIGEGTDAESYTWETSALYPWGKVTDTTYDGVDAVRTKQDSAASWMRTRVVGPAILTFYYKMRTYSGAFEVTCDGSPIFSRKNEDVSSMSWAKATANIPAGEHVIRFAYTRSTTWYNAEGVWVDKVSFQGGSETYTVTYKPGANGSGTQQTATKTKNVALTLKGAIFTRPGYTQTGWSKSDGGSKAYNLSASYTENSAITLYPYWTANAPANDNFSSPTTITGTSGSKSGSNVSATMQTSETKPLVQKNVGASVWYKWTAPATGTATFDTIGSSFDTVLAVYTGTSVSSLSEVASDDDTGGSRTSKLTFQATSGTIYWVAVYGYSTNTGSVKLNWSLAMPTTYTVTLDRQNGSGGTASVTATYGSAMPSITVPTRTSYTFGGYFTQTGGNGTQYYTAYGTSARNWDKTSAATLYAKWTAVPATYTVTYKPGSYGSGSQQTATKTKNVALTLKGAIFTRANYTQTGWATSDGGSKVYNLGASYTANAAITLYPYWTSSSTAPANDNFSSPTTISGASGTASGSNVGASMQTSEKKPSVQTSVGASVWYKWTAPSSGTVTLDTIGSSFDTVLAVYIGNAHNSLFEVTSDDDSGGGDRTSRLTFQAVSGTDYRIAVYGYSDKTGSIKLKWSLAHDGGDCLVPLVIATPWTATKAVTMNGAVYDDYCNVMGVVQLKVGKPKKDKRTGNVTAKVTGYVMLMDGKKKSLKSTTVQVPSGAPIEVSAAVNGLGTLTASICDDRFAGSLGGYIVRTANVGGAWTKASASAMVDFASGSPLPAGTLVALLPFNEPAAVVSGKWKFGKAASVKMKNGVIVGIDDPAKPNLSGLKLAYTPKKGTFKGSFNFYALEGAKLKKYKVNVSGVVVGGVGYGQATCKKPALSWPVEVE